MPKVSHTHDGPFVVAGVAIAPGGEAEIDKDALDAWSRGRGSKLMLAEGVVTIAKAKRARKPKADEPAAEDEPKADDDGGED